LRRPTSELPKSCSPRWDNTPGRTSRTVPEFRRMAATRCKSLLSPSTAQAFSRRAGLLRPLLTSAPRSARLSAPPVRHRTRCRPPGVSPASFIAHPPDLHSWPLMDMDFAISCPLVRPDLPHYPIPVRRVATLLHASFRPPLARPPLRFARASPPSGCTGDLHPQDAGRRCASRAQLVSRCMKRNDDTTEALPG
jgi:hypothetical protein